MLLGTRLPFCWFPELNVPIHNDVELRVAYTFWSFMRGARDKNIGWRLDYFLTSNRILDNVSVSDMIEDENKTSDHCPIILKITI